MTGFNERTSSMRILQLQASDAKIRATIAYYIGFIALGIVAASLGPTLPGLAAQTSVSLGAISFLFTVRPLGYLVGTFLSGRVYDRLDGHHLLMTSLILLVITLALTPAIPLLWLLVIVFGIMGIAEGLLDVGANTLLIWLHRDNVDPYLNGLHFFFGLGAFIAPLIVALVLIFSDTTTAAYPLMALLMLPAILLMLRLPAPTAISDDKDNPRGETNYLLVGLVMLFMFLYVGVEIGFGGWVFTYATEMGLASETTAAYLTSAFWAAFTVGRLLGIPLASRFRPHVIVLVDLIGSAVSLLLILLVSGELALWIGAIGLGLALASVFPTMLALIEKHMRLTGHISSLFFLGVGVGAMVLPWTIGQFIDAMGPEVMPWLLLGDLALTFMVFGILMLVVSRSAARQKSAPSA
jgi:MFS transporter, FHS family, Na+ dependent glucose transporter 1